MTDFRLSLSAFLAAFVLGSGPAASAATFDLELVRVTAGSDNGASTAVTLVTDGDWTFDDDTDVVTLNGTMQAEFDINPLPGNELFNHRMTDVEFDLNGMAISGAAYECIEATFGGTVGSNLCANVRWGANFINETTWDYSTVPGTRVVDGDDEALGPQQQLSDYASALVQFDGTVLIIESPAWTANPGVTGIQMEFLVTNAPSPVDVPMLIGLERSVAEAEIVALGLAVGSVAMTNDPIAPVGSIISQNPLPCSGCARLNDKVDLVVSLGPLSVLSVPEQIDDLVGEVRALNLPRYIDNYLVRVLRSAAGAVAWCGQEAPAFGGSGFKRWYDWYCRNDGADVAVWRLQSFIRAVNYLSYSYMSQEDAAALAAGAQRIIDDIMREPPVTGLYTLDSGGRERTYYLRVPTNYTKDSDPLPIIFGFHGATDTYNTWFEGGFHGDGLQNIVGDQAIMVFPQALEGSGGVTLWNAEVDFEFWEDLLRKLQDELNIDPNRIFATGHSNGGGFSHQLGCAYGDVLRAIAPSSGFLLERDCTGAVAVLQMQSTVDQVANIELVKLTRDVWAAYNGFDTEVFADGDVEPCVDYSLGTSLYPLQWCPHESFGADGHQWWDGADAAIWNFFSSLPTAVPSPEPPPGGGNDRILEAFPASLSFAVRYPAGMNQTILLTAVLYPPGTEQPIFNAPLWFLNSEIPFAPATPGTEQVYENVPISLPVSTANTPLPGTYTLSIGVFVEGGSFPIPATGIDHIALIEVEIQDQLSPIIVDEVLELVPVVGF